MSKLPRILRQESGAASIEYGLLAGLIAVAIVLTVTAVGGSLQGLFTAVSAGVAAAA